MYPRLLALTHSFIIGFIYRKFLLESKKRAVVSCWQIRNDHLFIVLHWTNRIVFVYIFFVWEKQGSSWAGTYSLSSNQRGATWFMQRRWWCFGLHNAYFISSLFIIICFNLLSGSTDVCTKNVFFCLIRRLKAEQVFIGNGCLSKCNAKRFKLFCRINITQKGFRHDFLLTKFEFSL